MPFGFTAQVSGPFALFTRPELKVERYSYDTITPSAARGLLEAVFWKPGMRYVIDRIHVLAPIRSMNLRRNEVSSRVSASNALTAMNGGTQPLFIATQKDIVQRASLLLRDVHYLIDAHFVMTDKAGEQDSEEKFYNMILRRLRKGQCYHQPYLGCREFAAKFSLLEGEERPTSFYADTPEKDFGLMLYDMDYQDLENIRPTFFHAVMKHGVIDLVDCEVFT